MKTSIYVTNKDIKNGEKNHVNLCPIALAATRKIKSKYSVDTWYNQIKLDVFTDTEITIKLPQKASDFITIFDEGGDVKPFKFTVDIPKNCHK